MASKIAWHLIPRKTIAAESVQLVVALACLGLGWITFPLLYALTGIEVLLVTVISGLVYRQKGIGEMAVDVVKMIAMWLFCGVFAFAAYYGANGFADGFRIEPRAFGVLAGLAALRLAMAALDAHSSRDPRLQWTREVAMRGAVLALSMFFAAFVCFIPGVPLAALLKSFAPAVATDVALGFCLLAVQGFLACVVATMTPEEIAQVSRQPYLGAEAK